MRESRSFFVMSPAPAIDDLSDALAAPLALLAGSVFVQFGVWGGQGQAFCTRVRMPRTLLLDARQGRGAEAVAHPSRWPLASGRADAVFLPYTLEGVADPHACLREAVRVLTDGGRVLVAGHHPYSLPDLNRRILGNPPGSARQQTLTPGRTADWLELLGCETLARGTYGAPPGWRGALAPFHGHWWLLARLNVARPLWVGKVPRVRGVALAGAAFRVGLGARKGLLFRPGQGR